MVTRRPGFNEALEVEGPAWAGHWRVLVSFLASSENHLGATSNALQVDKVVAISRWFTPIR